MSKDVGVFLQHILESIAFIEEYSKGISEAEFLGNRQIQDAVIRRLEICGEAIKNIPKSFREKGNQNSKTDPIINFNNPSTFSYHCSIHPTMTGRVVVGD